MIDVTTRARAVVYPEIVSSLARVTLARWFRGIPR